MERTARNFPLVAFFEIFQIPPSLVLFGEEQQKSTVCPLVDVEKLTTFLLLASFQKKKLTTMNNKLCFFWITVHFHFFF